MKITLSGEGELRVVRFDGSIDTATASDVEAALMQVLSDGATKVVLNFEKLVYINSAGLRVIMVVAKELKHVDGALRLCSVNAMVQEVLDFTKFSNFLHIAPSESDALSGL